MRRITLAVSVFAAVCSSPRLPVVLLATRQTVQGGLPANLQADPILRPFLDRMFQFSPTFRRQCARIAAEPALLVRMHVDDRRRVPARFNAWTVLTHRHGSLVSADVQLKPSPQPIEFIAHELEHIVGRLDDVDLQTQAGNGVVWKTGDGAFETRRAIEVGRRVAREAMSSVERAVRSDTPEGAPTRLMDAVQQDRDALPASEPSARVSQSGRYVVFTSVARLVDGDDNRFRDIYVLDLTTGTVTLESAAPAGAASNGDSASPAISRDGRYVVFDSVAGNLTGTPLRQRFPQVFLRDRANGATRLLSANVRGEPANGWSRSPAISADGTSVVFESSASDLSGAETAANRALGVFLIRLTSSLTTRVDVSSDGDLRIGQSVTPSISADGRIVVFMSKADLTCRNAAGCAAEPVDANGLADIYLHDTTTCTTRRVTRSHGGGDPDGPSYQPAVSGDGRYVAFVSAATNLTRHADRAAHPQVYLHDLVTGLTELVSRTPSGRPVNGLSLHPAVSYDASIIAFQSLASDLLCDGRCAGAHADTNLLWDVFVHDRRAAVTLQASTDGGDVWMGSSRGPTLDDTGRVVAFASRHPRNRRDHGHDEDVYVMLMRRSGRATTE